MSEPGKETLSEIEAMRAELARLTEFEQRVKSWTLPQSFYALFMHEYAGAKSPTATVESCTRAALSACVYRAFKLAEGAVSKEEAEKIRSLLPG